MGSSRFYMSVIPIIVGLAGGIGFYLVVAIGVFYFMFGPGGWLVPEDGPEMGYWIGRVMSSWINMFSFIAFFVALALLAMRFVSLLQQEKAFSLNLLGDDEETLLLPEDAQACRKTLRKMPEKQQRLVLVDLLRSGLQRSRANWSSEDTGHAIKTQAELIQGQTEADYSLIRYLVWAIPSIGFIGTVLGIGQAMGSLQAEDESEMMSVAAGHLSMAFDTTFVALVLSLVLMYVLHKVQAADDTLLVRATDWCMRRLVFRMHVPSGGLPR